MARDAEALILQLSADVRGLEKQFAKANKIVDNGSRAMERRAKVANDNITSRLGKGAAGVFDEVAGRAAASAGPLNTFASGLGAVGVASIATTAALAGVGLAATKALEAMNFGDQLQATADKIGVTAERLQELQYAADETDVPIEGLEQGLQKLNAAIGAFKTGVGDGKVKDAFKILGIKPEDLKGVRDASDLLPVLADKLGKVGTVAEQVQIAKKLGIEDLLPLLRQGSDGLEQMSKRARELGLVLSNETVKALADADRQMELAGQQINTNLRAAFSGLAVDIAAATTALANFLTGLRTSQPALAAYLRAISRIPTRGFIGAAQGYVEDSRRAISERRIMERGGDLYEPLNMGAFQATFGRPDVAGFDPIDKGGSGRKARDTSEADAKARREREKRIANEIYQAELDLLDLHNGERRSAEERLDFALEREAMVAKQRKAELGELEAQYRITAGKEGISAAERARLESLEAEARSARERNLKDEAALKLREEQLQYERDMAGYLSDVLGIQNAMATTQAERRKIQLQILENERAIERKTLEESLSQNPNLSPEQRAARLGAFDATTAARRGQVLSDTRGPLESYLDELPGTIGEVNEAFQRMEAEGLSSLIDGLAAASVGAADLGDVFRSTIRQMAMDANRILLQNLLSGASGGGGGGLFSSLLSIGASAFSGGFGGTKSLLQTKNLTAFKGFANGTNSAPGGLAWVGERGPELLNIPRGSQIIPNDILRGLSRQGGGNSRTYSPTMHVNVYPQGPMSSADARRTGSQISAAAMQRFAAARKAGF